jgi:hypothetical protein
MKEMRDAHVVSPRKKNKDRNVGCGGKKIFEHRNAN